MFCICHYLQGDVGLPGEPGLNGRHGEPGSNGPMVSIWLRTTVLTLEIF